MARNERAFLIVLAVLAATLAGSVVVRQRYRALPQVERAVELAVAPSVAAGPDPVYRGDPQSPFTLVEFADYQCPPCGAAEGSIRDLLSDYVPRLKFVFRNLPIQQIHPAALPAALAAEGAREQGCFWEMHDALFANQRRLSPSAIDGIADSLRIDRGRLARIVRTTARAAVERDRAAAKHMSIRRTPSFLLCCPDRRVIRLGALAQIADYVPRDPTR